MTNRGATALSLFTAPEGAYRSRYVGVLYRALLNRPPEHGGWVLQRNTLAALDSTGDSAGARTALVSAFVESAEFKLLFRTPSNAEFVRIIYRQVLGREATQAEVDWQVGVMAGANAQVLMARDTLLTPEVVARFEGGIVAQLLFHALLLREAHPTELVAVERALAEGKSLAQAVSEVVASAEFEALYK